MFYGTHLSKRQSDTGCPALRTSVFCTCTCTCTCAVYKVVVYMYMYIISSLECVLACPPCALHSRSDNWQCLFGPSLLLPLHMRGDVAASSSIRQKLLSRRERGRGGGREGEREGITLGAGEYRE